MQDSAKNKKPTIFIVANGPNKSQKKIIEKKYLKTRLQNLKHTFSENHKIKDY